MSQQQDSIQVSSYERFVALVNTDIADFTRMDAEQQAWTKGKLERWMHRAATSEPGGSLYEMAGDGGIMRLDHPPAALRAAFRLRRMVRTLWPFQTKAPELRFAITAGSMIEGLHNGRINKLNGTAINESGRLIGIAQGGQVLLSGFVHDDARTRVLREPRDIDDPARDSPPPPSAPPVLYKCHGTYWMEGVSALMQVWEAALAGEFGPTPEDSGRMLRVPDTGTFFDRETEPRPQQPVPGWPGWQFLRPLENAPGDSLWIIKHRETSKPRLLRLVRADRHTPVTVESAPIPALPRTPPPPSPPTPPPRTSSSMVTPPGVHSDFLEQRERLARTLGIDTRIIEDAIEYTLVPPWRFSARGLLSHNPRTEVELQVPLPFYISVRAFNPQWLLESGLFAGSGGTDAPPVPAAGSSAPRVGNPVEDILAGLERRLHEAKSRVRLPTEAEWCLAIWGGLSDDERNRLLTAPGGRRGGSASHPLGLDLPLGDRWEWTASRYSFGINEAQRKTPDPTSVPLVQRGGPGENPLGAGEADWLISRRASHTDDRSASACVRLVREVAAVRVPGQLAATPRPTPRPPPTAA